VFGVFAACGKKACQRGCIKNHNFVAVPLTGRCATASPQFDKGSGAFVVVLALACSYGGLCAALSLAGACRLCTPSIDAGCHFCLFSSFAAVFACVFVLYTTVDASATLLHIFSEKGEITGNLHWHLGQWSVVSGSVPVLVPLPRPG